MLGQRLKIGHFKIGYRVDNRSGSRALPVDPYCLDSQGVGRSNVVIEALGDVDVLAGPMTPITAHKIGATEVTVGSTTMTPRAALTQYTRPYNLSGFPAMSVPCGFSAEGMPIGLQLGARPFAEEMLLRVAHAYEQATEWHKMKPSL